MTGPASLVNRDASSGAISLTALAGATTNPQCWHCGRLMALLLSVPWSLYCHRCKALNSSAIAAALAVLDRTGLKPTSKLELTGAEGGPLQTESLRLLSNDELGEHITGILEAARLRHCRALGATPTVEDNT